MTDCATLIAELEAADVCDLSDMSARELEGGIALALGWKQVGKGWAHWTDPDGNTNRHVPFYTTSLDAALTLVPGGWVWHVQIDYELPGRAHLYNAVPGNKYDPPVRVQANGATPALALCVAALKALDALKAKEPGGKLATLKKSEPTK